jgi:hypothetical protein
MTIPATAKLSNSHNVLSQFPEVSRMAASAGGPNNWPVLLPMTINPLMVPMSAGVGA